MIDPPEGGCCLCIMKFTVTAAFAALFIWLSLWTSKPICSIELVYVSALNKTANNNGSYTNTSSSIIHYDLKLNNKNDDKGIYYDALNLTFYYKGYTIGNGSYGGFYQGHSKSTHRVGDAYITPGRVGNWEKDAITAVAKNGTALFRVEFATAVRYKIVFWKKKRRRLALGADFLVNDQGSLVKRKKNKGIKLTSGVAKINCWFNWLRTLISVMIVIHLWQ